MSLFEFLMVLVSLIIGLGIAELLSGIANIIRYRGTTKTYWIHSTFVLIIFLALLQQWWEVWGLRNTPTWTFPGLIMMLSGPVGLFLVAHLIFPEPVKSADFRDYYYSQMRPVLWLSVATILCAVSFRPLVLGTTLFAMDNLSSFLMMAIFASLTVVRKSWYHGTMVSLVLTALLADIVLVGLEIQ